MVKDLSHNFKFQVREIYLYKNEGCNNVCDFAEYCKFIGFENILKDVSGLQIQNMGKKSVQGHKIVI